MSASPSPPPARRTYAWWAILCLVGLDYFSTLAYLPSLAEANVGALAPVAAVGVVLITLLAALPVYFYVVGRSPHGEGGTGLLERNLHGWGGKLLILVVLGFVATDFVVTRTLSVADASNHILANPTWRARSDWLDRARDGVAAALPGHWRGDFLGFWNEQLVLTVVLSILAFGMYAFLVRSMGRGFLRVAVLVVVAYLGLTAVVVGSGLHYAWRHPELTTAWQGRLHEEWGDLGSSARSQLGLLLVFGLLAFPPMALGLSGFELVNGSAPLVRGRRDDDPAHPRGRIQGTRRVLIAAALVMSVFVLGSQWVVTTLVPHEEIVREVVPGDPSGKYVEHRALAYVAHGGRLRDGVLSSEVNPLFGPVFGGVYDLSAVAIRCLAGASATIGLRDLVPGFLARFGMELQWAHKVGVILHLFNVAILVVTIAFQASVTDQQWAYASSVLALLLTAALATLLDLRKRWLGSGWRLFVVAPVALVVGLSCRSSSSRPNSAIPATSTSPH